MERYVDRLVSEWQTHGKIIIAVDFDDTISHFKFNTQEDCNKVIDIIKCAQDIGAYVVVFTACPKEENENILNFCSNNQLHIDSINENPIPLPFGNNGKIYANIFLDDRGGLNEAIGILSQSIIKIKQKNEN